MRHRQLIFIAAVAVAACASSSGLVVNGQVERADGAPLEGARVAMSCPQALQESGLRLIATTDASGRTTHQIPPEGQKLQDGCEVFVTADGYEHARFPIQSVCSKWANRTCVEVRLRARLDPEGTTAPVGAIRLRVEMLQEGATVHDRELVAPRGERATITLRADGIVYEMVVVPTWIDERTVSLEGTWSTGNGATGVVNSTVAIGEQATVEFGSDDVVMKLTPSRERE